MLNDPKDRNDNDTSDDEQQPGAAEAAPTGLGDSASGDPGVALADSMGADIANPFRTGDSSR